MYRTHTCLAIFAFAITLGLSPFLYAQQCTTVYNELLQAESSIEIETPLDTYSAKFLTTADGTLASLYSKPQNLPEATLQHINKFPEYQEKPLTFRFDRLPEHLKLETLRAGIIASNAKFNQSSNMGRAIPGIIVKPEYQRQYRLRAKIDFANIEATKDAYLIEFHMRSDSPSGDFFFNSKNFYAAINKEPGPMHMHMVTPVPGNWLTQNPKLNAWRIVEFMRRINLTFEMRDVIEKGVSIIRNSSPAEGRNFISFDAWGPEQINSAFRYLHIIGNPELVRQYKQKERDTWKWHPYLGSRSKMGWIGFWGHDKYDSSYLMGFEFRFLTGKDNRPELVSYLNQFQTQVNGKHFGLTEEGFSHWIHNAHSRLKAPEPLSNENLHLQAIEALVKSDEIPNLWMNYLTPHRPYTELIRNLPYNYQRIILGMNPQKTAEAFNTKGRLRYLLHDWANDPILSTKPELVQKIEQAQLRALRRWAAGENETQVIQEFLINSGLYFSFADSIGLAY